MHWFEADAPIRQKTLIAFASLIAPMVLIGLTELVRAEWTMAGICIAFAAAGAWLASRFREAICVPYVSTVVRMEGLASGDLASPIAYSDHKDCVGRMARAMFTFKATAEAQQRNAHEQTEVVAQLRASLEKLSNGDLTGEITVEMPAAYAELKANFNAALGSLRALIGSVSESAVSIRTGAGEIAQASEDLARRTEANAAALEETSGAVGQMEQRLRAGAAASERTVARADRAIGTVRDGRGIASEAVQAMTSVSESARGIDSVIEGLDKIAFQTRVLAMNAAVEAGRAGEAGRGFAVVADLVSALAMRAEEEAGRARDQLTATQGDIVAAVQMVQRVDGALSDISSDVDEVHELLAQMAKDNVAQSKAIGEISSTIGSMDRATQQNAAMVEETSAAARNLASEVTQLAGAATKFKTTGAHGSGQAPGAASSGRTWGTAAGYSTPQMATW